jgi:two-component system, OmpR family, sensor kinase
MPLQFRRFSAFARSGPLAALSIKSKIIAFQILFIGIIFFLGAVVYFAIDRADRYIEWVSHAHRQLETITKLSLNADRYSEQIAEMLLFGEQGRAEFEEARLDLTASFAALEQITRREIDFLEGLAQQNNETQELGIRPAGLSITHMPRRDGRAQCDVGQA